jgi:hypothetical protein
LVQDRIAEFLALEASKKQDVVGIERQERREEVSLAGRAKEDSKAMALSPHLQGQQRREAESQALGRM